MGPALLLLGTRQRQLARGVGRRGVPCEPEAVDLERQAVECERVRAVRQTKVQVRPSSVAAVAEQAELLTHPHALADPDAHRAGLHHSELIRSRYLS